MGPPWIWGEPQPHGWCPCKRTERRSEMQRRGHVKTDTDTGVMEPHVKEGQGWPAEARRQARSRPSRSATREARSGHTATSGSRPSELGQSELPSSSATRFLEMRPGSPSEVSTTLYEFQRENLLLSSSFFLKCSSLQSALSLEKRIKTNDSSPILGNEAFYILMKPQSRPNPAHPLQEAITLPHLVFIIPL